LPTGKTRRAGDGSLCRTESSVGTEARDKRRKNQKSALGQWENQSALARDEQQKKKFSNKDKSFARNTELDLTDTRTAGLKYEANKNEQAVDREEKNTAETGSWTEEQMPTQKSLVA
jgi:hypothetical protein